MVLAATSWSGPALSEVVIDTPPGGWRHTGDEPLGFRQEVHYPASSVNVGAQPDSAQIRGRIGAAAKPVGKAAVAGPRAARGRPAPRRDRPAILVANGVAMPIEVNADGCKRAL